MIVVLLRDAQGGEKIWTVVKDQKSGLAVKHARVIDVFSFPSKAYSRSCPTADETSSESAQGISSTQELRSFTSRYPYS